MKEIPELYIRTRLKAIADRARRTVLVRGILSVFSLFLFLTALILYLDALVVPGSLVIMAALLFFLILQCVAAYRWVIHPFTESVDSLELSRRLERTIPAFCGRLTAAQEEDGIGLIERWGYSNSLREKAVGSAAYILKRLRNDVVARRLGLRVRCGSPRLIIGMAGCMLAISAGLILDWPLPLAPSVERILNPLALYRAEQTWELEVHPGNVRVMKGDSLLIEVRASVRAERLEPFLHVVYSGEPSVEHLMLTGEDLSYHFDYGVVDRSFRYYVTEGKRRSPIYDVNLVEPPAVTQLRFRIVPPAYTGLPPEEAGRETRELFALKGARVELSGRVSSDVQRAYLDFNDEEDIELEVTGGLDFIGRFPVTVDDSFHVVLVDTSKARSERDIIYSVRVLSDRRPEVRIVVPGADAELGRDLEEALRFSTGDDFGLIDLDIHYTVETREGEERKQGTVSVASFGRGTRDTVVDYRWDLKEVGLFPGERVRYRGHVRDGDAVSGPKSGWSGTFVLSLPTVAEIFSRRQREIEEVSNGVKELMEKTALLREAIASLEREMEVSGGVDWEGRKEASEILKEQEELSRELKASGDKFRRGERGVNPQIIKKAEEVSRLFQEVATPEMMSAIEELRKALDGIDPSLVEKALTELKFSEEDFLRGLERTYRALKRLQMEQDLDALVREVSNILERQQNLNERLESGDTRSEGERWRKEEESITSDMNHLMAEMGRSSEKLREEGEIDASNQLDSLSLKIENHRIRADMKEMTMVIGGGDIEGAMTKGEEIAAELDHLREGLEEVREGLGLKWKREMAEVIDRAIADLLALSSSEEELFESLLEESVPEISADSFISEQDALEEGLESTAKRLFRSTEETYFIGRDVGRKIGSALNLMRRISRQVESKGDATPLSKDDVREAFKSLNGAILSLMRDKESMMKSSSGVGFEEAFQQMTELAKAQGALNEKTAGMFPLPLSGRPGREQYLTEQLLRMAAEQQRIQRGLEALQDDFSAGSGLLGRVDQLVEEMKKVARDMSKGEISKKTLEQQRQIYSRLLDAEKSLRNRDFSRKREAERPEPYMPSSPPPLSQNIFRDDDLSGEGIFHMAEENYPEGYRDAIRAYFDELMKRILGEKAE